MIDKKLGAILNNKCRNKNLNSTINYLTCFIGIIVLFSLLSSYGEAQTSNIDLSNQRQYIRGFGGMNFPRWIADLTVAQANKAFGNGEDQLGLSILRISVSPNRNQWSLELPTAQRAKSHGAIILATPWSPPASMKTNNSTIRGELRTDAYGDYAKYLSDFTDYMHSNGASLYTISIQNEPDWLPDYESCGWNYTQMYNFVKNNASIIPTRVLAAEALGFNKAYTDPILNCPVARNNLDIVGGHLYGTTPSDYPLARTHGKEIWMTEHYTSSNIDANTWPDALGVGKEVHDCMVNNFNAYIWWYIRRFYGFLDESGNITKRGYVMSQFSKFVRPGYYRIDATANPASNVNVTAYKSDTSLVIIAINRNTTNINLAFKLQNSTVSKLTKYTTSSSKNVENEGSINITNDSCTVTLEGSSISTFVGSFPGWYRSFQSGSWNDVSTWEMYNGSNWENPVTRVPSETDGLVVISSGHQVGVVRTETVDQIYVQSGGILTIESDGTLLIKNGPSVDLCIDGTLKNFGNIMIDDLATIKVNSEGKYVHARDGGNMPSIIWTDGSLCEITGVVDNSPAYANQNYPHFIWNCPDQKSDLNLGWNNIRIDGDIRILSTGTGTLQLSNPAKDSNVVINLTGNFNQSSGKFTTHSSNEAGTCVIINHIGNVNITGGEFNISNGTQGGTGTTMWNLITGNFSISNAKIKSGNTTPLGARFIFKKSGNQNINIGTDNIIESLSISVSSATTLNMGASELTGNGHVVIDSGATLRTTHPNGIGGNIQVNGEKVLSKFTNFIFEGNVAQVTGITFPDTINNLVLDNISGLTLSSNVLVNGTLEMKSGALLLGDKTLSYGAEGTLKYSGSFSQTTTGNEFPLIGGPKNLVINNNYGVTLHASRELGGNIDFQSGKLTIGANSLSALTTTNALSARYVVTTGGGKLKLRGVGSQQKLFPVGISTYAPVWITNTGAEDDIEVGAISETTPAPYGGRLNVKWNISEANVGGGAYTMQFGWTTFIENTAFKNDRAGNAKIYTVPDTIEVGTGAYTTQFTTLPYTVRRAGITALGSFVVGKFSSSTSVEEYDSAIPTKFALSQNYPNPFNPITVIKYEIPSVGTQHVVSLRVYDILGKEVITLVNEVKEAGSYEVQFNATNISSGIYFYKLTAGNYTAMKKLVLTK